MKYKMMLIMALLMSKSSMTFADTMTFEHVTFKATKKRASEIHPCIFSVQIEGNIKNKEKKDDWKSLGTGFFVKNKNDIMLGVTCAHVVKVPLSKKKQIYVGIEDKDYGYIRLKCLIDKVDEDNDIAILRPQKGKYKKFDLLSQTFTRENFGNSSDIVPGSGVIIPGYPLGIGVEYDKNNPVFRIGIVAQYTGGNTFLVDSMANPGSSGSPVILLGMSEHKIIGMISSYKTDKINLFDMNKQLVAALPYNSGLSQGVNAELITSILDSLER